MTIQKVKEKILDRSLLVSALCCIIAGEIPISVRSEKKEIMTVAIATIPKSSGEIRRAKTAVTTNVMTMPLYLANAV